MSLNIFPNKVIKGRTSEGKTFEAEEYDYSAYLTLWTINILGTLLAGGLFCAISGPIVLIMLIINFNGKFNPVSIAAAILSGFFLYDCHNAWIFSAFLNIFIDSSGLLFLVNLNIVTLVLLGFMTVFGGVTVKVINALTPKVNSRWVLFIIVLFIISFLTWKQANKDFTADWLGITHVNTRD